MSDISPDELDAAISKMVDEERALHPAAADEAQDGSEDDAEQPKETGSDTED